MAHLETFSCENQTKTDEFYRLSGCRTCNAIYETDATERGRKEKREWEREREKYWLQCRSNTILLPLPQLLLT